MTQGANVGPRCAVIVGPYLSGKTNLFEALLKAIGGCAQKGNAADGTLVGDHSSEARKRQSLTQLSVAGGTFLDQPWVFMDTPGASEFAQGARDACMIADIVIVVVEPETEKMVAVTPFLYFLDRHKIPHLILINKMDQNTIPVRDLMAAFRRSQAVLWCYAKCRFGMAKRSQVTSIWSVNVRITTNQARHRL